LIHLFFKKMRFLPLFLLGVATSLAAQPITQARMDSLDILRIEYIDAHKTYALREMERSGIPASITLAQGLLETAAGSSFLARTANNHFGMKCGDRWNGSTAYKHDDEFDAKGQPIKSCFRAYADPAEGFADHSMFLLDPQKHNRYGSLFQEDPLDYVAWATGLQASGYAPAGHYSARLIEFVERYHLHELDYQAWNRPALGVRERVFSVNNTPVLRARQGETLASIAAQVGVSPASLVVANDHGYAANAALAYGALVFLAQKPDAWQASDLEFYFTQDGKTMFDVAQLFGIRLESLRTRNGLSERQEPALKAKIRLQGTRKANEKVQLRTQPIPANIKPKARNPKPPMPPHVSDFPINATNLAHLNQVLVVPARATRAVPTAPVVEEVADFEVTIGSMQFHEVASGDTLMAISRRYGVTVADLRRLNQLPTDAIRAGQRIRVR
jgi:LysM repeat protein